MHVKTTSSSDGPRSKRTNRRQDRNGRGDRRPANRGTRILEQVPMKRYRTFYVCAITRFGSRTYIFWPNCMPVLGWLCSATP